MGNPFDQFAKALNLKNSLAKTPLGPVMKALDKPYQAAISVTATALKGTPLEKTAQAFQMASVGKVKESLGTHLEGVVGIVKAYVPAVGSVPGIGLLTEGAKSLVDGAVGVKAAGGAASAVVPPVALSTITAMVGADSPLGPLLRTNAATPIPGPVTPTRKPSTSLTAAQNAFATVADVPPAKPLPPGTSRFKPKPLRSFSNVQYKALVNDPRSVGGTMPWNVP